MAEEEEKLVDNQEASESVHSSHNQVSYRTGDRTA